MDSVRGSRGRSWALLAIVAFGLGSLFGPTLVTAAQKASEVIIGNTASNPVPVTGTVNVGNLPATQTVDGSVNVGNFPATQAVSGTVNVGSLPGPGAVSDGVTQSGTTTPGTTTSPIQVIGNVVAVTFYSDDLAYLIIEGNGVGNGYWVPSSGEGTTQTFVNPLPSTSISVNCDPLNASPCRWVFAIATI